MVAGALLMLVAVLFIVGSFLDLDEYRFARTQPPIPELFDYFRQTWSAWWLRASGLPRLRGRPYLPDRTLQLHGISMVVVAVVAVAGAMLMVTSAVRRSGAARAVAVAAAAMAIGLSVTLVFDLIVAFATANRSVEMRLRPGFFVFAVSIVVAVAALVCTLFGGRATRVAPPADIRLGVLLIAIGIVAVIATLCHQLGGNTLWVWGGDFQFAGAPVVLCALVVLIAGTLSFSGRGRSAGLAGAAALFATGLLISLDTITEVRYGPVTVGDMGVGSWLLFVVTGLDLAIVVFAVVSAGPFARAEAR